MRTTFKYQPLESNGPIKFIQITDPHLFADHSGNLLGMDTLANFDLIIDAIIDNDFEAGFFVITGDLVHDDSLQGYEHFKFKSSRLKKPVFWIPGNHDSPTCIEQTLSVSTAFIKANKHILVSDKWQIILLDSQVPGSVYGELSTDQLDFLHEMLTAYPEHYSLIALHHHITPTNCSWLDQHDLHNKDELSKVLQPFNNVKGLFYGHVHQEVNDMWHNYSLFSTPATSIQFTQNSNDFSIDTQLPGWREFTLLPNGKIISQVKKIASLITVTQQNLATGY